jgi:membrane protein DedA with SNARE-associated domain
MADTLTGLFTSILAYSYLAGPAFGLLAFGESLVILGILIPATPILFLVGTLIGSRQLDPLAILPWALAGAITGYWASWALGRRSGHGIYASRRFRAYRREVARARVFFRRWGGPSLILGRYVLGPFQSLLPFVAGVATMPPRRFHFWNIVSSTIWVFVVLAPGYLVGRGVVLPFFDLVDQKTFALALLALSVTLAVAGLGAIGIRMAKARRTSRS